MGSIPHSPTKMRPASRDTGFPEPFCGHRNTTLPHPDADTSPNACISADDIAVHRVLSRQRRSFMIKHKRTISHGMITPEMERTYSGNLALLSEDEAADGAHDSRHHTDLSRPSKDSRGSLTPSEASGTGDEESPISPKDPNKMGSVLHKPRPDSLPQRRRSLLQRWMHRH